MLIERPNITLNIIFEALTSGTESCHHSGTSNVSLIILCSEFGNIPCEYSTQACFCENGGSDCTCH